MRSPCRPRSHCCVVQIDNRPCQDAFFPCTFLGAGVGLWLAAAAVAAGASSFSSFFAASSALSLLSRYLYPASSCASFDEYIIASSGIFTARSAGKPCLSLFSSPRIRGRFVGASVHECGDRREG